MYDIGRIIGRADGIVTAEEMPTDLWEKGGR
jgi:hypothetical protein